MAVDPKSERGNTLLVLAHFCPICSEDVQSRGAIYNNTTLCMSNNLAASLQSFWFGIQLAKMSILTRLRTANKSRRAPGNDRMFPL